MALRHRKVRQVIGGRELERQGAAPRDLQRVCQSLRNIGEQRLHFLGRLQVLLRRVVARPLLVADHAALRDADARLVRVEILAREEADIIGRDQRHLRMARQGHRRLHPFLVAWPLAAADLQIQAAIEDLAQCRQRRLDLIGGGGAEHAAVAPGKGDQPMAVLGQPLPLDQRLSARLALGVGQRDQLGQVAVARIVLDQQGEPLGRLARRALLQPHIGADDGLDAGRLGGLVELHHREQVVQVGDRGGGKLQLRGPRGQRRAHPATLALGRLHANDAVRQRELGVQPKVVEARSHASSRKAGSGTRESQAPRSPGSPLPSPGSSICITGANPRR